MWWRSLATSSVAFAARLGEFADVDHPDVLRTYVLAPPAFVVEVVLADPEVRATVADATMLAAESWYRSSVLGVGAETCP